LVEYALADGTSATIKTADRGEAGMWEQILAAGGKTPTRVQAR
jgi:hypothetical protein